MVSRPTTPIIYGCEYFDADASDDDTIESIYLWLRACEELEVEAKELQKKTCIENKYERSRTSFRRIKVLEEEVN
ncbi:hypothetical protein K449DRAFT_434601 [Hypoxylon sp. EC38]|nr:hypothetical protein K449DRAFT_434601 [Hypoxylon sp. EC38]